MTFLTPIPLVGRDTFLSGKKSGIFFQKKKSQKKSKKIEKNTKFQKKKLHELKSTILKFYEFFDVDIFSYFWHLSPWIGRNTTFFSRQKNITFFSAQINTTFFPGHPVYKKKGSLLHIFLKNLVTCVRN